MWLEGFTVIEQDIGERRLACCDCVRRTNAFFPGPPCAA
jgi:hypothetical protein